MESGKGLWKPMILFIAAGLLILESFSAYRFSSDWNLGVLLPGLIGAGLILLGLRPLLYHILFARSVNPHGMLYLLCKPLGRRLKAFLVFCLVLFLLFFTVVEVLIITDPYLHRSELAGDVDYLVVLGAGIWPDGRPTLALANRLDAAVDYYREKGPLKIIVSGGKGQNEPYPEGRAMAEYLIEKGIPLPDILVEDRSTSTMENFKFTRQLLGEDVPKPTRIVFITNDFHVLRSRILAKRNGFEAYALPAPTPAVILLNSYLREFFAFVKSMMMDY